MPLEGRDGGSFVFSHQTAIPGDVRHQDSGKPALDVCLIHEALLPSGVYPRLPKAPRLCPKVKSATWLAFLPHARDHFRYVCALSPCHHACPWGYLVVAANGDSAPALAGPAISFPASGGCRYGARRRGTARPSRHWRWPPGPPAWATPRCLSRPGGSGGTAFLEYPG